MFSGDAYLVCSGLPQRNGNIHCKEIASLSLKLVEQCEPFKVNKNIVCINAMSNSNFPI